MEALSPLSVNVQVKPKAVSSKQQLDNKAAIAKATLSKTQKPRDHAAAPPNYVYEPCGPNGEPGEQYSTGAFLGKGGFAICYEGELRDQQMKSTGHLFALKIVKAKLSAKKAEEKFRTELQIHSKMHHPNIVEFYRAFTYEESTYLVLELCPNGSIMDMVRRRKFLTPPEIRRYTIQLCGAIKYMHHRNVIHRDLKMGNLFLDADMNLKIGDFGLAAILITDKESHSHQRRTTLCGTPNYIAPEILAKGRKGHDHKVDIWSVGVIIFAMFTGCPPFQSSTPDEIYRKVKHMEYDWPTVKNCANDIPSDAKDLVSALLVEAEDRPEADEIVSHPFFKRGFIPDYLDSNCRQMKPLWLENRPPITDAIRSQYLAQWTKVCGECGVGRMSETETFPLVGTGHQRTIFKECVKEEKAGRTPVVPIPTDQVYISYPELAQFPSTRPQEEGQDLLKLARDGRERGFAPSNPTSCETASLPKLPEEKKPVRQAYPVLTAAARRPDTRSHAATLRQEAHPKGGLLKSVLKAQEAKESDGRSAAARSASDRAANERSEAERAEAERLEAERMEADRIAAERIANEKSSKQATEPAERRKVDGGLGLLREGPVRRSSREAEEGKPKQYASHTQRIPKSVSGGLDRDALKVTASLRRTASTRMAVQKSASRTEAAEEKAPEPLARASSSRSMRTRSGTRTTAVAGPGDAQSSRQTRATDSNAGTTRAGISSRQLPKPSSPIHSTLIHPNDAAEILPFTLPDQVLTRLTKLQDNLENALKSKDTEPRYPPLKPSSMRNSPVVIKWVDYTNKFGIGYILNDGSIGCVLNARDNNPQSCVVVRSGEAHLQKQCDPSYAGRLQIVPMVDHQPIEFFENHGDDGFKRALVNAKRFKLKVLDDGSVEKLGPSEDCFENKKRQTVVLWRKFANYMCNTLGKDEGGDDGELEGGGLRAGRKNFIRFYQRLGNVGVWGFGTGIFQFNFPDHTKLVLSEDGKWADFYHLPPQAARALKRDGVVPTASLNKREVLSYPVQTLLHGFHTFRGGSVRDNANGIVHSFGDIVDANELEAKIRFVVRVVGGWIENGGLGSGGGGGGDAGATGAAAAAGDRIMWQGLRERNDLSGRREKLVWVTVGAKGGDSRVVEEV
ncbi:MAG: hypothetical protein M1819_001920 [Sarea resinae]|nr:MAG: hypothetical protein M1819_001920 [Sarea resinae]